MWPYVEIKDKNKLNVLFKKVYIPVAVNNIVYIFKGQGEKSGKGNLLCDSL